MYTLFSHLPTLGLTLLLAADVHGAAFNLPKRDLVVNSALPSGWSYSGCYTDNTDPRTLHSDSYVDSAMTESSCINYCNGKGYPYAGIEYGVECYCDNWILDTGLLKADSECSFSCPGSSTEPCGAGNRMSIFTNGKGLSAGPVVNPGFDNWKSLGCYTDSISERTLEFPANVDGINSVSRCASACQQAGYTYAGMEYAGECYCGNSLRCPSAPTVASACNMACNGKPTEFCGGSNAMNVYQLGNDPLNACAVTSSSTSSSSAATPSATLPSLCPSSNNTVHTDATGQKYTTYCDYDYGGGVIQVGDLASFDLCLQECDTVNSCGAVAWTGGDGRGFCYLKEATAQLVPNVKNVMAAIRIPAVTSSSSSVASSSSSSTSSTITTPPVVVSTSSKGLGCANPTPTAFTISSKIYSYEWCMAYMQPGGYNFSPGSFEACAAACALGDCVAFNYANDQNCRTMKSVQAVTEPYYGWKAYSLVGVATVAAATPTPSASSSLMTISVTIISTTTSTTSSAVVSSTPASSSQSPSVTLGPYGTNACPNPTPVSFTISSKLYNYNMCMGFQSPGSMNMYAADAQACAALCTGDCKAFNFGDPQNCRTMNSVNAITAPFYGWSAYQFIGTATLPTTTPTPTPSPSPSITANPFGANACPNPTVTSYTVSNTLYRYNFCMAYLAPGSVNMYAANAPACAALCTGNCVAFNYGDPQNCRTMNRVDAITAPFYGWSAHQLIGATPLPTAN